MKHHPQLPSLVYSGNEQKKMTLHLFLQIIGKIRLELMPRKNHWWYITEYIDTLGITTGPMPYNDGFDTVTITLNVQQNLLETYTSQGEKRTFELKNGMSVAQFYDHLMDGFEQLGISVSLYDKPFDQGIDQRFEEITDIQHYDPDYTKTFWRAMLWVSGVFKEFSGRFYGKTCPVHLYWHSLDLAVTRFNGEKAPPRPADARLSDKDAYSHECISFGFWAGDENMQEPAFYSYTYPAPDGMGDEPLKPSSAFWNDAGGSPMAILKYSDLYNSNNPRKDLLEFLESAYQAGAKLAGWDVEELEVPRLEDL
ncbi:DUF5996 family protein [Halocola ammonii]